MNEEPIIFPLFLLVLQDCSKITTLTTWLKYRMLSLELCLYFMDSNFPSFQAQLCNPKTNYKLSASDNGDGRYACPT